MAYKLEVDFFLQDTITVAKKLLGKRLFFYNKALIITETEGYIGADDPACHGRAGRTTRNFSMFGIGGYTYVYFIYGMYYCLNFVTEKEGFPAAVLIRAGYDEKEEIPYRLTNGPGKLCKYLNITREHNNINITDNKVNKDFYIEDIGIKPQEISATARIGIKHGLDKQWRFLYSIN